MHDNSPYMDEKSLLAQIGRGDEQAFEKIYQTYAGRLYGNLLKLVKSESIAQEILQDVFLKIWDSRTTIDTEKSFRSFLFKIAENKVFDYYRKAARDKKKQAEFIANALAGYDPGDETIFAEEKSAILQKAIESLPAQRQQVFRLCKLEGKSYKEVSEQLGISVSTISDHIVKATKSIRDYFENNEQALMSLIAFAFLAGK